MAAVIDSVSCRFSDALFSEASSVSFVPLCVFRGGGVLRPRCEMDEPIFLKKSPIGFATASCATGIVDAIKIKTSFVRRTIGNYCARNHLELKEKASLTLSGSLSKEHLRRNATDLAAGLGRRQNACQPAAAQFHRDQSSNR